MSSVRTGKHSEDFSASPLVIWVQSYLGSQKASNDELANGLLLNNILNLIDPNAFSSLHIRNNGINDVSSRAQNLVEILNGIKRYYLEKLQQVVVMKMPDILLLAKEAHSEISYSAMNDILLLILGCAIQCEKKEEFIEHIKQLDVDVQRGLVNSIQEITENPDNVIPYRINELGDMIKDELLILCENLYRHLQGALEQRDDYIETIIDFVLLQDSEEYREKLDEESPKFRPRNTITQASFHSSNMLQAKKERISSLQAELDEQNVVMADMKEELDQVKMQLESMRLENKQLVNEAAWAKTYRDELDVLKSQLENANKLRSENSRLKGIVEDVELYKKKYEEIQDQTDLLYEQKLVLEEQAKDSASKLQRFNLLENENKKLCTQVNLLVEEQGEDQRRIRELVDEIAKLSVEKQESISACSEMNDELDGLRMQKQDDGKNVPLMVEYNQSADLLRLEKENKHLQGIVDTMSLPDNRIQGLENYNRNLAENIIYYKNLIGKLVKCLILAGDTNQEICDVTKREYRNMVQMLANLKQSSELDKVMTQLEQLVDQLAKKGFVIDVSTLKEALIVKSDQKTEETSELSEGTIAEQSKLRDTLEEKEKRISKLEESLSNLKKEKEKRISKLEESLSNLKKEKEKRISKLEESLSDLKKEKEKRISKLEESLSDLKKEKEKRISKLEESLSDLKKLSELNKEMENQVSIKEKKIMSLEKSVDKLDTLTSVNNLLNVDMENKERELLNLKKSMDEANEYVVVNENLKNELVSKDESILQLKDNLDRSNELITRMNSQLKNDVSEKEQKVAKLKQSEQKLKEVKIKNADLENDITSKDKTIAYLKQSLDSLNDATEVNNHLKEELEEKEKKMSSIKESIDKIKELNNVNEQLKDIITTKDQKLHLLHESVEKVNELTLLNNEMKDTLTIKERKISQLEKSLVRFEETASGNDEMKKIIEENDRKFTDKQEELKEREKEVESLQNRILEVTNELQKSEEKCEELKKHNDIELKKLAEKMPELQRSTSESSKLKSIVKEKDNQILLLHDSLNECQCKASQLETRIDELTSANSRSTSASQQQEERVTTLKNQLEEYLSSNRTLTNELKMKEEKMKIVTRSLEETTKRNNNLEEDINMLEKDLEQLKQTGSLKNITNITEKIKLTKRARTELHIQRCPIKLKPKTSSIDKTANIEVKSSLELVQYRELVEKLHQENQCMEKQTASMTEDIKNLSHENAALQSENETIVSTLNLLKLDYEAIQKEMDEAREHFQELDISATKIAHRCEVLVQLNATLEEENKAMMEQVNKLFAQNQELLVSTLYSQEQYSADERSFTEHIYELEREKDKLSDQVSAAEKALQQDGKRKGAIWRGTHKILKRAGLARRKDSNQTLDLDIQDIERECDIIPLARENRTSLESLNTVRSMHRLSNNPSPPISAIRLNQRSSDSLNSSFNPIRAIKRNGDDSSLLQPVQRNGDDSDDHITDNGTSVACTYRGVQKNGDDSTDNMNNSLPQLQRDSDDNSLSLTGKPRSESTPIQKVFVTQLTTPQVMKASPDGLGRDYHEKNSPTFIRKLPSTQSIDKDPIGIPIRHDNTKGLRKTSFSTSSGRSSPLSVDMQSPFIEQNNTSLIDRESKLLDRRRYNNFKEITTDTMSLDSSDDNLMYKAQRSESLPPNHGGPLPFGSREQRSSFRRYEIEHMEPRPLPHNGSGWFGSEENLLNTQPLAKSVTRKKIPDNGHSTDEQRTSLRKVMIGKNNKDISAPNTPTTPTGPRKDFDSNTRKVDQSWYEYGHV